MPAPQLSQTVDPAIAAYLPSAHGAQPELALVEPTLVPKVPAGQLRHDDEPDEAAYLPSEQLTQAVGDEDVEPAGHGTHADEAAAPNALE